MLGAVFSFRGRVNRLQYLAGCVGLGVGVVLLAVIVLGGAVVSAGSDKSAMLKAGLVGLLFLIVVVPLYLWISLSLQARRLRDIGWEPIFVIPALFVFDILDRFLALGAPQIAVTPGLMSMSWLGVCVNLGLTLCLFFWPGRPEFDVASVFDDEPPPARTSPARPAPTPVATRAPVPSRPAAPRPVASAPAGFGRRGL